MAENWRERPDLNGLNVQSKNYNGFNVTGGPPDSPSSITWRRWMNVKPVGYVADECHRSITSGPVHGEQSFLDTRRPFGALRALACQSAASLRHALGGEEAGECYALLPEGRFERQQLDPHRFPARGGGPGVAPDRKEDGNGRNQGTRPRRQGPPLRNAPPHGACGGSNCVDVKDSTYESDDPVEAMQQVEDRRKSMEQVALACALQKQVRLVASSLDPLDPDAVGRAMRCGLVVER